MLKATIQIEEIIKPENPTPSTPKILVLEIGKVFPLITSAKTYSLKMADVKTDSIILESTDLTLNENPPPSRQQIKIDQSLVAAVPDCSWTIKLLSIKDIPSDTQKRIKTPKLLWEKSQSSIRKIEELVGNPVIAYYTSPESSITQAHPEYFMEHLKSLGHQETISLIVISRGGSGEASLRIASLIREQCRQFHVIIPSKAASAATILALGADKIYMTSLGYLTAIDVSTNSPLGPKDYSNRPTPVASDQVQRIVKLLSDTTTEPNTESPYKTLFPYIHPLLLGEVDRNSTGQVSLGVSMMKMHPESFNNDTSLMETISKHLTYDYPFHGFPILFNEAKTIGLPVEKTSPELSSVLWDLVKIYDESSKISQTTFSPDSVHHEQLPVIIESIGKRTTYHHFFDRIINSMKHWETYNEEYRWINLVPSPEEPGKCRILSIDYSETTPPKLAPPTRAPAPQT